MPENRINRREFIHRSTLGGAAVGVALKELDATAPDPVVPVPANDKITVGMIGVGARAHELMQAIMTLPNTEIVGVNARMPAHVVAMGQLYRWKESPNVPDTIDDILEYPEGFKANLSSTFNNQSESEGGGFQILGTKGSLVRGGAGLTFNSEFTVEDNRWIVENWPAGLQDACYRSRKVGATNCSGREPEVVEAQEHCREVGLESTGRPPAPI